MVRAKSMVIDGRHKNPLKVGVRFKDYHRLGCVYSDLYQGNGRIGVYALPMLKSLHSLVEPARHNIISIS